MIYACEYYSAIRRSLLPWNLSKSLSYVVSSSFYWPSSVIHISLFKLLGLKLFYCLVANSVRTENTTFTVLSAIRIESLSNTKGSGYCTRSFIKLPYTDSGEIGVKLVDVFWVEFLFFNKFANLRVVQFSFAFNFSMKIGEKGPDEFTIKFL